MKLSAILAAGLAFATGSQGWSILLHNRDGRYLHLHGNIEHSGCHNLDPGKAANLSEVVSYYWNPAYRQFSLFPDNPIGFRLHQERDCTGEEFVAMNGDYEEGDVDPPQVVKSYFVILEHKG